MNAIKFWFDNARTMTLPQSLLPAALAIVLAGTAGVGEFSWILALCAILGVMFAHLGLNLFDDYFDYIKKKTDYREELVHEGFRARIGKCTYLTSEQATLKQLLAASFIFSGVAVLLGTIIWLNRSNFVLYIVGITVILGIFYSAPPLRLSYRGFGELIIGVIFGPLNMIGAFYAACGAINTTIVLISIAVGLLVMNIIFIHSILDRIPDKKVGKKTMAILLNNTTTMLCVLFFIIFVPFALIAYGIIANYLSSIYWVVFLVFPLAISLFYSMVEFIRNPERKFSPKFWLGPMENWQEIEKTGLDWFMIRWYSARNLVSFFCFIIILINIVTLIV